MKSVSKNKEIMTDKNLNHSLNLSTPIKNKSNLPYY